MPDFDPTKTPGRFEPPPAHAPHEVAQPLSDGAMTAALEQAAAHEQVLPPFDPPATGTRMGVAPPTTLHAPARTAPPSPQPAASHTDSPSRGLPREILDPGKQITGGFGPAAEAQYFPLDGPELRELIRSLMDKLNTRIENDLRFHIAITYPRVRARVVIEVEAYANDGGFTIEAVGAHEKTPLAQARQIADRIAFVVVEQRQEFSADGAAEDPPDRIRDELGLAKPRKQQVETPGGRMFVDRPSTDPFF